jgi:hypothetical protein
MDYQSITKKIINLKNADLAFRDKLIQNGALEKGYHEGMEQLHNQNAQALDKIINQIGYPTIEKVGKEACEAAWLVIQHSIGQPDFMRKCRKLLENVDFKNQVNPTNLAYLTDRIASFEGKPQRYGTQFDWDENGELSPNFFDDLIQVNQRRKSVGLNTLEEQITIMRRRAKNENQSPPTNFEERKQDFEKWKRKVGWIK